MPWGLLQKGARSLGCAKGNSPSKLVDSAFKEGKTFDETAEHPDSAAVTVDKIGGATEIPPAPIEYGGRPCRQIVYGMAGMSGGVSGGGVKKGAEVVGDVV